MSRICLVLAAALLIALGGCGRKGDPELPEGVSDNYPRGYPAGAPSTRENIYRTIRDRDGRRR